MMRRCIMAVRLFNIDLGQIGVSAPICPFVIIGLTGDFTQARILLPGMTEMMGWEWRVNGLSVTDVA